MEALDPADPADAREDTEPAADSLSVVVRGAATGRVSDPGRWMGRIGETAGRREAAGCGEGAGRASDVLGGRSSRSPPLEPAEG